MYSFLNRIEKSLKHSNASGETLAFYNFGYDAASLLNQITDVDGTTIYTYDNTNQLTGADRTATNNPDDTYTYDANGNRVTSSEARSLF